MEKQPSFAENESREDSLDPILDSIMTAEEYAHFEHPTPYTYELKVGDKELYYFGSPHVSDPDSPIFGEIEASFKTANPDIVFVEGMKVRNKEDFNQHLKRLSLEEMRGKMSEPTYTVKLALEKGAEWHSPEPTDTKLFEQLLSEGFSQEEIFTWNFFRMLPQYNREMKQEGFEKYVQPYLDRFQHDTNWEGFDYSYVHAMTLGERIMGEKIDVENDYKAGSRVDPIPWEEKKDTQTVLNSVNRAASRFRDKNIVTDIAESLQTRNRIFIVFGASHAAMQEPALKKLFERYSQNENSEKTFQTWRF